MSRGYHATTRASREGLIRIGPACSNSYMSYARPLVAYYCMEFGLSEELPIYSGGLGVLAGDFLRAARALALPVVGVGLLYGEGYTRQTLDAEGRPEDRPMVVDRALLRREAPV